MKHPHRGWIEKLLERLAIEYETHQTKNEVFYIVTK